MIPEQIFGNLVAWMEQVLLIASVGSLLLVVLRIRHPRTQLAYCHTLLAVCLLLPLMEPWRHQVVMQPVAITEAAAVVAQPAVTGQKTGNAIRENSEATPAAVAFSTVLPSAKTEIPWTRLALWILASGIAARLCWLAVGLFRIRRFRIAAMPLYPIPEPVRAASALTHADALFCISAEARGPVMLGWLAPVVLLPEAFLTLGEEAQCGIACHELLHVRRHDWLVTMFEEIAGALLWFNPAAWMLLAQTRLAREQLVDEETVRLTSAREPYIDALLTIARGKHHMDLAPAPLFLRRRHLTQRMRALLKEVSVSRLRLAFSYGSMSVVLALAGWLALTAFPLTGSPQFKSEAAIAQTPPAPLQMALPSKSEEPRANPPRAARVPFDAQEPVTGTIRIPATPTDRAALLGLLERASQNSKLHLFGIPPWRFDVSFQALGNSGVSGLGQLSETWFSGQRWRWTANLGDYSVVRIGANGRTVEEKHVSGIPMRAQMLREAILWSVQTTPSNAQIRSADVSWNGKPATCLLTSGVIGPAAQTQTRLWEELEFCIDNASGLMQLFSIAPGTYYVYDYSGNLQYHGRAEPNRIAIYVGGSLVVDARFTITDAGQVDERLLTPTPEMIANGPVIAMGQITRTSIDLPSPLVSGAETVIVHAEVDGSGRVVEEELSAASDPALAQPALDFVRTLILPHTEFTQRQEYVSVRFVPPSQ